MKTLPSCEGDEEDNVGLHGGVEDNGEDIRGFQMATRDCIGALKTTRDFTGS